jgi:hypothetical protein
VSIESWIDHLVARWGTIEQVGARGALLHAYRVFEVAEFPEALGVFPCAITYPVHLRPVYSAGGPCIDLWRGVTEFHLFPSASKSNLPALTLYFARIRAAAAGSITLGGRVAHFLIRTDVDGLLGPVELKYGTEEPHWGILCNWEVKENVSGSFAVAA